MQFSIINKINKYKEKIYSYIEIYGIKVIF